MESQPIQYFILGVMTLTDARYFSAMGVNYLHFDLNPDSPYAISQPAWSAIIEWVEGTDIVCSFDHLFDEEEIRKIIDVESVTGVLSRFPDMLDFVHRLRPDMGLFQQADSWEEVDLKLPISGMVGLEHSPASTAHFMLCNGPMEAEMAVRNGATHIAIHPGSEDEVGIKDFEAYDRLLYGEF